MQTVVRVKSSGNVRKRWNCPWQSLNMLLELQSDVSGDLCWETLGVVAPSPSLHFTLFSVHFITSLSHPHFLFIPLIFTLTLPLTQVVFLHNISRPYILLHATIALTVKVFSQFILFSPIPAPFLFISTLTSLSSYKFHELRITRFFSFFFF